MKRFLFFVLVFMGVGCGRGDGGYRRFAEAELASGKTENGLVYDIHFGMPRRQFYTYVWGMHQKDSFDDGSNSTAVLYRLHHQLKQPASMLFYPVFQQDTIYRMWATFNYDAWAPWNKNLWSDSLMLDVVRWYTVWYPGNDFIKITDPKRGTIYVKVDGNRRIIVGRKDDAHVNVDYTNLRAITNNTILE
jgi:hypothetical protein